MTSAFVCFSFTFVFVQIPFVSRVEIMKTTKEREMPKKSNLHNKRTAKHERSVSRALDTSQWKKRLWTTTLGLSKTVWSIQLGSTGRIRENGTVEVGHRSPLVLVSLFPLFCLSCTTRTSFFSFFPPLTFIILLANVCA